MQERPLQKVTLLLKYWISKKQRKKEHKCTVTSKKICISLTGNRSLVYRFTKLRSDMNKYLIAKWYYNIASANVIMTPITS